MESCSRFHSWCTASRFEGKGLLCAGCHGKLFIALGVGGSVPSIYPWRFVTGCCVGTRGAWLGERPCGRCRLHRCFCGCLGRSQHAVARCAAPSAFLHFPALRHPSPLHLWPPCFLQLRVGHLPSILDVGGHQVSLMSRHEPTSKPGSLRCIPHDGCVTLAAVSLPEMLELARPSRQ